MSAFFRSIFILLLNITLGLYSHVSYQLKEIDENSQLLTVDFKLSKKNQLYKDSISFSVDSPDFKISDWQTEQVAVKSFDDQQFKDSKIVYNKNTKVKLTVTRNPESEAENADVFLTYLVSGKKSWQEKIIHVKFKEKEKPQEIIGSDNELSSSETEAQNAIMAERCKTKHTPAPSGPWSLITLTVKKIINFLAEQFEKIKDYVWGNLQHSESIWFKIFLAFMLGLMMSLTPCIYPMIPVTIGILQQSATKSFVSNVIAAVCYTLGIGLTFAAFGLLASFGSMAFGQILGNPIFVIALVLFLGYLAFSMFGFYEMYIPRFLQPKDHRFKHGSYLSAFVFGAASGTIASPCLSPGLALILSIVATMANKFLGFMMLFAFGVGSSFPLLIIATFSTSINLLPQAGMWMVEVKKIFGFLLIGMCFYYLQAIIPWWVLIWILASFILASGVYYIYNIKTHESKSTKRVKSLIGMLLIASSFIVFMQSYKTTFMQENIADITWITDYSYARQKAETEAKNLFIDFGAKWCSICKAIENTVLVRPEIKQALNDNFILLKVDGTNSGSEPYASLNKEYNITGFPTLLVVDPKSGKVLKKYMGEFYDMPTEQIVKELLEIC